MVVGEASINNIMGGIESTGGVRLHNHRRKLKQRFDIIKKLGQGTYGKVQLGINKETGQEVAIKTIKKCKIETEADLIRIRREIQIMSSVQHPNIIHIYEVFENREKMVLVMEYAAGGELYDYLSERKVLSETEARRIFRQVATAVYYCHKHKICHRDLKLENILLDENGNAKIADFGLSNVFDEQRLLSTFCGSPLYASPEIVKGTPYEGPEVDCWSLGVLLYTLVYGAMPFDGSNFKRLVKQISQGDYFEPKKPSPASPLIKEMLTVSPAKRANIEKICQHWWVNASYDDSCLEIAEDLANQTPVRLDLLLSLAPPPPQVGSDKLVVTGEVTDSNASSSEAGVPARSLSVGSIMDLGTSSERRIKELKSDDQKQPKRKLEPTVSTENFNKPKRKEPENSIVEAAASSDVAMLPEKPAEKAESPPLSKDMTQIITKADEPMSLEASKADIAVDPSELGAACAEIIQEAKDKPPAEPEKSPPDSKKEDAKKEESPEKPKVVKKKIVKKKVLTEKNTSPEKAPKAQPEKQSEPKEASPTTETPQQPVKAKEDAENQEKAPSESPTNKPVERRRSKIFETAEKFQNLLSTGDSPKPNSSPVEKPKKIFIPGVNVGGFKQAYERKASLTSGIPTVKSSLLRRDSEKQKSFDDEEKENATAPPPTESAKAEPETPKEEPQPEVPMTPEEVDRKEKMKNAVSIISNAIDQEGTRKSKSRPCMVRKPPIPFGISGRSASGSIGMVSSPSFPPTVNDLRRFKLPEEPSAQPPKGAEDSDNVKSSMEIKLKSSTVPRRTSKAEIVLDYSPVRKSNAGMEFKTEMSHKIEGQPKLPTQRSEAAFPVTHTPAMVNRSTSLEPESKMSPKERIIPICFEKDENESKTKAVSKPPAPKPFQSQRSVQSVRSNSLSRQSTQDSDTETVSTTAPEPIRKSPREYIIPIAVEGGGYVTPRATSLEPSESTASGISTSTKKSGKFSRTSRMSSLLSDRDGSEDETPFGTLYRHSSINRDSDNEDPYMRMHRLRSSRPSRRANIEHTDSVSSGEEEDDDDGFEILTAEKLFSSLLSRVRSLTQRLNVEDGGRPGFPSSRFLSHFDHGSNIWNLHHQADPFARHAPLDRAFSNKRNWSKGEMPSSSASSTAPWRRSVSRDLASDIQNVLKDNTAPTTPSASSSTSTVPRDNFQTPPDPNLKDTISGGSSSSSNSKPFKLSEEDARALSYLTPSLSRRIQRQLFAVPSPGAKPRYNRSSSMFASPEEEAKRCENGKFESKLMKPTYFRSSSRDRYIPFSEGFPKDQADNANSFSNNINSSTEGYKKFRPQATYHRSISSFDHSHKPALLNAGSSESERSSLSPGFESKLRFPSPSRSDKSVLDKFGTMPRRGFRDDRPKESPRRVSRFLRPDFYEVPKEESAFYKEKKERELETQKVLKEIRDKRRSRYAAKEKAEEPAAQSEEVSKVERRARPSKLLRPKSYPANDDAAGEAQPSEERKSLIENVIHKLREQSVPKNTDYMTESRLIKRAVSADNFSKCSPKSVALPSSKNSVSKILDLFKKYEEESAEKPQQADPETATNNNNTTTATSRIKSRLPINNVSNSHSRSYNSSNRRSLNLDSYMCDAETVPEDKPDKTCLRLNLAEVDDALPGPSHGLVLASPSADDDSWSNCSDLQQHIHRDLSPVSPSGDETNESVSDRIRRKSFYMRFNEMMLKKPRRSSSLYDHSTANSTSLARFGKNLDLPEVEQRNARSYRRTLSLQNAKSEALQQPTAIPRLFCTSSSSPKHRSYARTPDEDVSSEDSRTLENSLPPE